MRYILDKLHYFIFGDEVTYDACRSCGASFGGIAYGVRSNCEKCNENIRKKRTGEFSSLA